MPARRSRFRPARLVAIFMALLSLAVAILWADSYRSRGPNSLGGWQQMIVEISTPDYNVWYNAQTNIGMDLTRVVGKRTASIFRTYKGRVRLSLLSGIPSGSPPAIFETAAGGFSYKQSFWITEIYEARPGQAAKIEFFQVRKISCPFWSLFIFFIAYPTIYFIRGPLRRRKRRRRGQCLDCGYDLRGSAGNCPECGATALVRLT